MSTTNAISTLLTRARAAADQRAAAATGRYQQLVRDAAAGREIDPEKLVSFLDEHGFDVIAFQADVENRVERLRLRELVDAIPAATKRREVAVAAVATAEAERIAAIAAANARYEKTVAPLNDQARAAEAAIAQGNDALQRLAATAPADLVAARDEVAARLLTARKALLQLVEGGSRRHDDPIEQRERDLAFARGANQPYLMEPDLTYWRREKFAKVARCEQQLADAVAYMEACRAQLPEQQQAITALEAELAAAEAALATL